MSVLGKRLLDEGTSAIGSRQKGRLSSTNPTVPPKSEYRCRKSGSCCRGWGGSNGHGGRRGVSGRHLRALGSGLQTAGSVVHAASSVAAEGIPAWQAVASSRQAAADADMT